MTRHKKEKILHFSLLIVFAAGFVAASAATFLLWVKNKELAGRPELEPVVYHSSPKNSFFTSDEGWAGYGEEGFLTAKNKLVADGKDFIEVDLRDMKIRTYNNGRIVKEFTAQSKGKEGSWWETTTGLYSVGVKRTSHFSSISQVWMPYSIQFYGNFFIHGWPYDVFGRELMPGSSGGCIRMRTEDAKELFGFAESGMPVLVFDESDIRPSLPALSVVAGNLFPPSLSADSVLVAELDTGEILLSKNSEFAIPAGALTKAANVLTASEIIYLENNITIHPFMVSGVKEGTLDLWRSYRIFDLFYPMLMQGSDEAALAVSYFLGTDNFVEQMNKKVQAIRMSRTSFVDSSGRSSRNLTTLSDAAVLMKYIKDKRSFLFGISKGTYYPDKGGVFVGIDNKNPFYREPGLLGIISGRSEFGGDIILAVWQVEKNGAERNIMTAVAGSEDGEKDIENIRGWLKSNFELEL